MENYRQIKVIGKGSFGQALLVQHVTTQKMYVIKKVNLSALSRREQDEAHNETRVLSALNHPNVVAYRENFMSQGWLCIVMDYCDGGDLAGKISERAGRLMSEDQVIDLFVQICLGLKHVHDRKILHRDLKPQNIFMTKAGMIKLGDFGIAKVLHSTMELAKTAIGTPYYLSPEICQNKKYNNKTDIWSLGCILYELMALRHAFEGRSMKELMNNIIKGVMRPLPSTFSADLRALVGEMLSADPKNRPGINRILARPIVQRRIQSLLSTVVLRSEFSHTVLHGQHALQPGGGGAGAAAGAKPMAVIPERRPAKPAPAPAPAAAAARPASVPAVQAKAVAPVPRPAVPALPINPAVAGAAKPSRDPSPVAGRASPSVVAAQPVAAIALPGRKYGAGPANVAPAPSPAPAPAAAKKPSPAPVAKEPFKWRPGVKEPSAAQERGMAAVDLAIAELAKAKQQHERPRSEAKQPSPSPRGLVRGGAGQASEAALARAKPAAAPIVAAAKVGAGPPLRRRKSMDPVDNERARAALIGARAAPASAAPANRPLSARGERSDRPLSARGKPAAVAAGVDAGPAARVLSPVTSPARPQAGVNASPAWPEDQDDAYYAELDLAVAQMEARYKAEQAAAKGKAAAPAPADASVPAAAVPPAVRAAPVKPRPLDAAPVAPRNRVDAEAVEQLNRDWQGILEGIMEAVGLDTDDVQPVTSPVPRRDVAVEGVKPRRSAAAPAPALASPRALESPPAVGIPRSTGRRQVQPEPSPSEEQLKSDRDAKRREERERLREQIAKGRQAMKGKAKDPEVVVVAPPLGVARHSPAVPSPSELEPTPEPEADADDQVSPIAATPQEQEEVAPSAGTNLSPRSAARREAREEARQGLRQAMRARRRLVDRAKSPDIQVFAPAVPTRFARQASEEPASSKLGAEDSPVVAPHAHTVQSLGSEDDMPNETEFLPVSPNPAMLTSPAPQGLASSGAADIVISPIDPGAAVPVAAIPEDTDYSQDSFDPETARMDPEQFVEEGDEPTADQDGDGQEFMAMMADLQAVNERKPEEDDDEEWGDDDEEDATNARHQDSKRDGDDEPVSPAPAAYHGPGAGLTVPLHPLEAMLQEAVRSPRVMDAVAARPLPSFTEEGSDGYQAEALRAYLEEQFGMETLIEIYTQLAAPDASIMDVAHEEFMRSDLLDLLPLVARLVQLDQSS